MQLHCMLLTPCVMELQLFDYKLWKGRCSNSYYSCCSLFLKDILATKGIKWNVFDPQLLGKGSVEKSLTLRV